MIPFYSPELKDFRPGIVPGGEVPVTLITPNRVETIKDFTVSVLGAMWRIKKGSTGDLMSYPWFAAPLYDPFSAAAASIWHDERYKHGDALQFLLAQGVTPGTIAYWREKYPTRNHARMFSDIGWYLIAISGHSPETRMPKWKARLGYEGLKLFAFRSWKNHRAIRG